MDKNLRVLQKLGSGMNKILNSKKAGKIESPPIATIVVAMTTDAVSIVHPWMQARRNVWLLTLKIFGKFTFLLAMDETRKPLLIPPEFSNYAERHEIFQTIEVWHTLLCFMFWFYEVWSSKIACRVSTNTCCPVYLTVRYIGTNLEFCD